MAARSFSRYLSWLCAGIACLLMAACATPGRIAGSEGPAFERTGRFALSVSYSDGRQDAVQGGFAWRDDGRALSLDLANPLGSTLARVQVVPGHATLVRPDGSREQAEGPDALVELVLGSPIPVSGLRDWLQGRTGAAPASDVARNAAGQITGFEQNGWRVALSGYDALGPRTAQLDRGDAGRRVRVRLAVDAR